jgi:Aromatic-ring-opening dioxygenase LigAB, LigA subunit
VTDYWLNKLFFDLQQPELAAQYKQDPESVLSRYPLSAERRRAVLEDDLPALAPHVNALLLRFYFTIRGVKDAEFVERLNELPAKGVERHG